MFYANNSEPKTQRPRQKQSVILMVRVLLLIRTKT